jgi:LmbE family N-acetylglucosaminyl deacetylase
VTLESASNAPRFEAAPLTGGGTSVREWLTGNRFPDLDLTECPGLTIVAPHPDDETLGLGGTAAQLATAGVDVQLVAVSDGGAADPDLSAFDRIQLERTRRVELSKAASILGVRQPIFLGLPDGALANHEQTLADLLAEILADGPAGTWCATTWRGDGHPDHEAVGRASAAVAKRAGTTLLEFPIWMWHWAYPGDPAVPWDRAYSVPLSRSALGRKQHAAQCFRSQFEPRELHVPPLIPAFVLRRLLAVGEVVFR